MKSLALAVINQTEYCNGHGQMEISSLSLKDALKLCEKISKILRKSGVMADIIYLQLFPDMSCSVLQSGGIKHSDFDYEDKLLLGIEKVTL